MNNRFTRIAILKKDGHYGVITVDTNYSNANIGLVHVTSSFDSRRESKPYFHQIHPTPAAARESFEESVAAARDRGWAVAYNGERNHG